MSSIITNQYFEYHIDNIRIPFRKKVDTFDNKTSKLSQTLQIYKYWSFIIVIVLPAIETDQYP